MRRSRVFVLLVAACALVLGSVNFGAAQTTEPGPPSEKGVQPVVVAGNTQCGDVEPGTTAMEAAPANGTYTDGTLTVVISDVRNSRRFFDWDASEGIDAVIVRSKFPANYYNYEPEQTDDGDLHAPLASDGRARQITHISFCYDHEEAVEGPPGDPTCSDGLDNDSDELFDQQDPDCQEPEGPPDDPTCSDGVDNDGDGLFDDEDPDCQPPAFSCRASVARVDLLPAALKEPVVANPVDPKCIDDSNALVAETTFGGGPTDPGSLTLGVANAITDDDDGGVASGNAQAYVATAEIRNSTGTVVIGATALQSQAQSSCAGGLTGSSSVATLTINGTPTPVPATETSIPLGPAGELGTLWINYNDVQGGVVTQRALFLDTNTPLGDIVVAESIADIGGGPCPSGA